MAASVRRTRASLRVLPLTLPVERMLQDLPAYLSPRTRIVALSQASNAIGTDPLPIAQAIAIVRRVAPPAVGGHRWGAGGAAPAGRCPGARLRLLCVLGPQAVRADRRRCAVGTSRAARRATALAERGRYGAVGDAGAHAATKHRRINLVRARRRSPRSSGSAPPSTTSAPSIGQRCSRTKLRCEPTARSSDSCPPAWRSRFWAVRRAHSRTCRWCRLPSLGSIRMTSAQRSTSRASRCAADITARSRTLASAGRICDGARVAGPLQHSGRTRDAGHRTSRLSDPVSTLIRDRRAPPRSLTSAAWPRLCCGGADANPTLSALYQRVILEHTALHRMAWALPTRSASCARRACAAIRSRCGLQSGDVTAPRNLPPSPPPASRAKVCALSRPRLRSCVQAPARTGRCRPR